MYSIMKFAGQRGVLIFLLEEGTSLRKCLSSITPIPPIFYFYFFADLPPVFGMPPPHIFIFGFRSTILLTTNGSFTHFPLTVSIISASNCTKFVYTLGTQDTLTMDICTEKIDFITLTEYMGGGCIQCIILNFDICCLCGSNTKSADRKS